MRILTIMFTTVLISLTANAERNLPEMFTIKYENGLVTLRTHDVIPKSTNDMNDRDTIEAYKNSLLARGYKAASCTQVDGYGLSYAVQCVAFR